MQSTVNRQEVKKLIGKKIYAVKKDGAVVTGLLRGLKGNELIVELPKGKNVKTKAFLPLVLFDLLAIGTGPYGYGGYPGYGYPGYYGYGGYPGGFFW
ncbi:50S ribosomal protein L33 [Paenibacillus flagellatus]|uniref:50S ribosomal protein L33 n=1 Tax=Paenibacillus flagellatus TaxID=2211139 RepID=A0A2V5KDX9_9BACL|nr:50S ribosomal protein L33 [Paenibacillus flagellatus]PYI57212.1 50S ribosomal protein L33 [Paenibacillus flagellatus]